MRRARRRQRDEGPSDRDRWLVSYADFITLLFAFFTTLYAISVMDSQKGERLVQSIRESFGQGVFDLGSADPEMLDRFFAHHKVLHAPHCSPPIQAIEAGH